MPVIDKGDYSVMYFSMTIPSLIKKLFSKATVTNTHIAVHTNTRQNSKMRKKARANPKKDYGGWTFAIFDKIYKFDIIHTLEINNNG